MSVFDLPDTMRLPRWRGMVKIVACAGAGDGRPNRWLSFSHPRVGYRLTKFDTGDLSLRPDVRPKA